MKRACWILSSILSLCIGLPLGLAGCGGSSAPTQPVASLSSTVDAVVNAALQQQSMPGVEVALAKNGTILYAHAYGFSNLIARQATQTDTIFQIGSITKQFTAALIMKLQEQGKLHVDDSINLYLPEYSFNPSITIRMLLTHTSGLWNYTDLPQYSGWAVNGVSEATVLTAVSQQPLKFPPGAAYSYSNSNFFALGAIIEKVTGESYAANLQQSIFQPLGLANTYYSLPPASQSATGYINSGVPDIVVDRSAPFAAGALSSNVSDLVAWDNALINGKVVTADSFKAMTTSNGFTTNGASYGFGLGLATYNNRNIIEHGGAINGFSADNLVFLDNGFTVVVLTNDAWGNPGTIAVNILNAVCNSTQLSGNC